MPIVDYFLKIFKSLSKNKSERSSKTVHKLTIDDHKKYLNDLYVNHTSQQEIKTLWQKYYDQLDIEQKQAIWSYANWRLPKIKNLCNDKLINLMWARCFYSSKNLIKIANQSSVKADKGYGLIYCYLINDKLRYIGQTREKSLSRRMTKRQQNNKIGYNKAIKRNLINAYREGSLSIRTQKVKISHLDKVEEQLIRLYSPTCKLWNQIHNDYFDVKNYNF